MAWYMSGNWIVWFAPNQTIPFGCKNTVYCTFCNKPGYNQIKVGQSQRELKQRCLEDKTSVRTYTKRVVGEHFNEPGHSIYNREVAAIEFLFDRGWTIIEKRESMWIEAEYKGLTKKQCIYLRGLSLKYRTLNIISICASIYLSPDAVIVSITNIVLPNYRYFSPSQQSFCSWNLFSNSSLIFCSDIFTT